MKSHVYQFALRRADNGKEQFIIEKDLIYTDEKLTREQMQSIADKNMCDVNLTYLGVITSPKKEENINIVYHTQKMIEENLKQWHREKESRANG